MAQKALEREQVHPALQESSGEGVAQGMDSASPRQSRHLQPMVEGAFDRLSRERTIREVGAGEEPLGGAIKPPVGTKFLQQARRQERVAVLAAFSLNDADLATVAEQVVDLQVGDLAYPQTRRIGGHEDGAMLPVEIFEAEEPFKFLVAVDLGPADPLLHAWERLLDGLGGASDHAPVEEPQRAYRHHQGSRRQSPDAKEVQQVLANLLVGDLVGAGLPESGEVLDPVDVDGPGRFRVAAQLEFVDEPLS